MRFILATGLVCLGVLAGSPAQAQDDGAPRDCKVFDGQQWASVGQTSMAVCLTSIDQRVSRYNAQGFKFGMWGQAMLSADSTYFYRSPDGGKNWQALGIHSQFAEAEAPAEPAAAVSSGDVVAAVEQDAYAAAVVAAPAPITVEPAAPVATQPVAPAPIAEPIPTPAASVVASSAFVETPAPTPAPTPTPAAPVPAPVASALSVDRRSCSLGMGTAWERIGILTLRECAEALDRMPDQYDQLGFKYGYWNGVFLAANRTEVLSSTDSRSWQPLIPRAVRR